MTKPNRPTRITCARCGAIAAVGQRGPVPAYCSATCRTSSAPSAQPVAVLCAHCQTSATVRLGAKYCSVRCRRAGYHAGRRADGRYEAELQSRHERQQQDRQEKARPCPYCSTPMLSPRRIQCGAPDCKRQYNAERGREWQQQYQAEHGEWYRAANYGQQQRDYDTQRRTMRPHWRIHYPEAAALADARRRMLVTQASAGERFAPIEVFERDGWTCGPCMRPVDPAIAWPDPMSASVDHIVPLSRGGAHALANVQCAHLGCNSSKGDRDAATQAYVDGLATR